MAEKKQGEKLTAQELTAQGPTAQEPTAQELTAQELTAESQAGNENPPVQTAKGEYEDKVVKVKVEVNGGPQFEGVCTAERIVDGQKQVFLKVKGQGQASRWFNAADIA